MADAAPPERLPRKGLARVALARRRDVGMGEYPLGRDRPARADVARERDRRLDLALGKGRRAAVMARIDDLDPDRGGVQVAFALPRRLARVPRPIAFRDQLVDRAVFPDKIMRRDLARRDRSAPFRAASPVGMPV